MSIPKKFLNQIELKTFQNGTLSQFVKPRFYYLSSAIIWQVFELVHNELQNHWINIQCSRGKYFERPIYIIKYTVLFLWSEWDETDEIFDMLTWRRKYLNTWNRRSPGIIIRLWSNSQLGCPTSSPFKRHDDTNNKYINESL